MVINELLKKGMALIEDVKYSNPLLESILILSAILNIDKVYIYTHGDKEVEKWAEEEFLKQIEKRSRNYPIAYILKKKEFMGLDFYVDEGVLIPRPETEIMIEYIIDYVEKNYRNQKINILDLGTGSGAIALSLGKFLPKAKVYGIDIDPLAIQVSKENKSRLNIENVFFLKGDLFKGLERSSNKKFEIIVSNPPYIKRYDIESLQIDVRDYEPLRALDGGIDGLDFYRRITEDSKYYLKSKGMLIYEVGYNQGQEVKSILMDRGFSDIMILKDLQEQDRIVLGFFK